MTWVVEVGLRAKLRSTDHEGLDRRGRGSTLEEALRTVGPLPREPKRIAYARITLYIGINREPAIRVEAGGGLQEAIVKVSDTLATMVEKEEARKHGDD